MVRVWDCETGVLLERFEGHSDSVYSVAFSPDGLSLVSGALDQSLKIWDLSPSTVEFIKKRLNPRSIVNKKSRHTFTGHKDFVLSVAYIGKNSSIGRVNTLGENYIGPGGEGLSEIEWVVSASKDWTVTFWDCREGVKKSNAAQFLLQGHVNSVISIAIGSCGLFATGAGDRKARIWRVTGGNQDV